jgi:integrase
MTVIRNTRKRPELPAPVTGAANRAAGAGGETPIGCLTFRATRIMGYLTNGGRIEVAQCMAGHSNGKKRGFTVAARMT